jgi:NDP-sugar pyrophosphorylase family protein
MKISAVQPARSPRDRRRRFSATRPHAKLPALLHELIRRGQPVRAFYTTGNWLDIDSVEDLVNAGGF